ncbi:phage holin family protein [uncultured Microbacterium sp.]|jgi:cytochrome c biogenesis protein CcdA|uniref:phage holin family protein n=1 Tax=uncultured Microbacterium sp. TaxID=191216 RepID=UPI0025FB7F26|nr:phage holin family protein [uncultured Microbacterium sp.]
MALIGKKDKADESLFTLIGQLPALIRNLVVAEINQGKAWLAKTAKDYGFGAIWFVAALFVLFWLIPVLLTAAISGIATVWPVWLSALVVAVGMLIVIAILVVLGLARFKKASARENPVQALKEDVTIVREAGSEF